MSEQSENARQGGRAAPGWQELVKDYAADLRAKGAARLDASRALEKYVNTVPTLNGQSWGEHVLELMANALALGDEPVRAGIVRDPEILRVTREQEQSPLLMKSGAARGGFMAELLALALKNAEEIFAGEDFAGNDAGVTPIADLEVKALVKALMDNLSNRPLRFDEVAQGQTGARLARQMWRTVEARAAWVRTGTALRSNVGLQKYAGRSPAEILREAAERVAKIERECDEKLAKIEGGNPLLKTARQLRSARTTDEVRNAARSLGDDLAKIGNLQDLRK